MADVVRSPWPAGVPQLLGPDGKPLVGDGMLAPAAYGTAAVYNQLSRLFSSKFDEAMRDNPLSVLEMRRDPFIEGLLRERFTPTIGLKWAVKVPDPKDVRQAEVAKGLTEIVRDLPDEIGMRWNLMEAVWGGRYGSQLAWGRKATLGGRWGVLGHQPVHGDSIQFQWDGTPVVLVNFATADAARRADPANVIGFGPRETWEQPVVTTDRGGYGLRLASPRYRKRFVIHKHIADAADFFEGELAGGIHGVGLRSRIYFGWFMRREILTWMLAVPEGTGIMDIVVVNYSNSDAGRKHAEKIARSISGKTVLLQPRPVNEPFKTVETVPLNAAGIEVLKGLITDFYERHVERVIVGQSMSAGGGGAGGLEGDGRAEFSKDTKYQLCRTDALRLQETYTRDLLTPMREFNYPDVDFPVWFEFSIPDPDQEKKVETGLKLVQAKVAIKADELREAAGFTKPGPDDEVVGGPDKPPPGTPPGQPGGAAATTTPPAPRTGGFGLPAAAAGEGGGTGGFGLPAGGSAAAAAPGMAELVAAMAQAAQEGDWDAVRDLREIGEDPAALAGLVDDLGGGGGPETYQWARAETRSGGVKAVWSGAGDRRPLYGKRAEEALARGDAPAPGPVRGAAGMARDAKPGWEAVRADNRPVIDRAFADPGSVRPHELAGLEDKLHSLTRDELRRRAAGLQQKTGGKVKGEIVAGLLAHVRAGREAAPNPPAGAGAVAAASPSAAPPLSDADFAKEVQRHADEVPEGFEGHAWIGDVYGRMAQDHPGLSRDEFDRRLLDANAAGRLLLMKKDLHHVSDPATIRGSEVQHPLFQGAYFHGVARGHAQTAGVPISPSEVMDGLHADARKRPLAILDRLGLPAARAAEYRSRIEAATGRTSIETKRLAGAVVEEARREAGAAPAAGGTTGQGAAAPAAQGADQSPAPGAPPAPPRDYRHAVAGRLAAEWAAAKDGGDERKASYLAGVLGALDGVRSIGDLDQPEKPVKFDPKEHAGAGKRGQPVQLDRPGWAVDKGDVLIPGRVKGHEGEKVAAPSGPLPAPVTPLDREVHRDAILRLASAHAAAHDAGHDVPQDHLAAVLRDVGAAPIDGGETGVVPFLGRHHEAAVPVSTGQPVRVTRPGWAADGTTYAKAKVEPAGKPAEVAAPTPKAVNAPRQPASPPPTPRPDAAATRAHARELYAAASKAGFDPARVDALDAMAAGLGKADLLAVADAVHAGGRARRAGSKGGILAAVKHAIRERWTSVNRVEQ